MADFLGALSILSLQLNLVAILAITSTSDSEQFNLEAGAVASMDGVIVFEGRAIVQVSYTVEQHERIAFFYH